jgi:hypothetical protein
MMNYKSKLTEKCVNSEIKWDYELKKYLVLTQFEM